MRRCLRGFSERDHNHSGIMIDVVEVFADTEDAAAVTQMPMKRIGDAGLIERVKKYVAGDGAEVSKRRHRSLLAGRHRTPESSAILNVSLTKSSMACCMRFSLPTKKWSAPGTMTSF